jgi:hypothetical protein
MKPAAKSRTAAELAMVLAAEERGLKSLTETSSTDFNLLSYEVPSSMAGIISVWQQAVAANDAAVPGGDKDSVDRIRKICTELNLKPDVDPKRAVSHMTEILSLCANNPPSAPPNRA